MITHVTPVVSVPHSCICCGDPITVYSLLESPGWTVQHRDWNSIFSYSIALGGSVEKDVRSWLQQKHQHAALQLCGEIVELYKEKL